MAFDRFKHIFFCSLLFPSAEENRFSDSAFSVSNVALGGIRLIPLKAANKRDGDMGSRYKNGVVGNIVFFVFESGYEK